MKSTIARKITIIAAMNLVLLAVVSIVACLASLQVSRSTDTLISMLYKMEMVDRLQFAVTESVKMNDFLISGDLTKNTAFELSVLGVEQTIKDIEQLKLNTTDRTSLAKIKHQFVLLREITRQICEEATGTGKSFFDQSINSLVEDADKIAVSIVETAENFHDSFDEKINEAKLGSERLKRLGLIIIESSSILAIVLGIGGSMLLALKI